MTKRATRTLAEQLAEVLNQEYWQRVRPAKDEVKDPDEPEEPWSPTTSGSSQPS